MSLSVWSGQLLTWWIPWHDHVQAALSCCLPAKCGDHPKPHWGQWPYHPWTTALGTQTMEKQFGPIIPNNWSDILIMQSLVGAWTIESLYSVWGIKNPSTLNFIPLQWKFQPWLPACLGHWISAESTSDQPGEYGITTISIRALHGWLKCGWIEAH